VRPAEPYFERVGADAKSDAIGLAMELIKQMSGCFEPEKMPDDYARAIQELVV
jgi:non-homologous end joining protein Ku